MESDLVLHYRQGNENWRELILTEGQLIVGRGNECDLQITDKELSRKHLSILKSEGKVWITDLNSTNGTRLDGETIQPGAQVPLSTGQEIQIGSVTLKIQDVPSDKTAVHAEPEPAPAEHTAQQKIGLSDFVLKYRKGTGAWQELPLPLGEFPAGTPR